jgi:4-diphosphocytidyl-2-C-methyl-D-erythritol kinase
MQFERLAPAKVNLFLHVGPLGADGYHPLSSLMAFADVGDVLRIAHADEMSVRIEGPFGAALQGDLQSNLVVRARDAIMAAFEGPWPNFRLTLDKRLPIAAGLGGGSCDAAATLNLIAETFALNDGGAWVEAQRFVPTSSWRGAERMADDALDPANAGVTGDILAEIAAKLGADVTACLASRAVLAQGRGDECDYPPVFPDLDAVLVNPNLPVSTAAVYGAFDSFDLERSAEPPPWPEPMDTPQEVAAFLAGCRNDLEAPAISLQPAIGVVLGALRERPQTLFARMSGSGATCFAICADRHARQDLAFSLAAQHPDWWVQPCRLGGFRP